MDLSEIVKNIKKFRENKQISLNRLAELTGLTKGYLSKIEHSSKVPPYSTLLKIAQALRIDVNLLLSYEEELPQDMRISIVRKSERKEVTSAVKPQRHRYEAIAYKKLGKNMEPFIVETDSAKRPLVSHEGEELIFILEGQAEFSYDGVKHILNEGDTIYFDSVVPHNARAIGDKKCKSLVVSYSYKRM
jgi:transcriptional regulator with XRE-family HTH domain